MGEEDERRRVLSSLKLSRAVLSRLKPSKAGLEQFGTIRAALGGS
jgi:hypothetical protein